MKLVNLGSILLAFAVACGGKSGTTPTTTTTPEPTPGPLAAGQWESMDHEARADFMGKVVLPTMAAEFKAFDGTRFAELDCKTCHGKGAEDHSFEMPNPDLPVLSMELFQNPPEEDKAILAFMSDKVKPKMAELLGMPMKSETQDGFGCDTCHTFKE